MVDAAATTGTGSDALKRNDRALCFTRSTTSSEPRRSPPMPPNVFENVVGEGECELRQLYEAPAAAGAGSN